MCNKEVFPIFQGGYEEMPMFYIFDGYSQNVPNIFPENLVHYIYVICFYKL